MFWTMVLSAWSLLHAYVFWRAATTPVVTRRASGRVLAVIGITTWASAFLLRAVSRDGGVAALLFDLVVMHWLVFLFLTAVALLAVDLPTLFGLVFRTAAPRLRGLALLAGSLLSAVALVQGLRPPVVSSHQVEIVGLPPTLDGTTLVALSDLHLGDLTGAGWMAARARQVRELRPDAVLFLGDLFEGHGAPDPAAVAALSRISAPLGVWGVAGNHESHGGSRADETYAGAGIHVLDDASVEIAPGLVLAGVSDRTLRRSGADGDAVSRVLSTRPAGATVLLAHRPWQAEAAARSGAALMLSGHTHAGQVWPFGHLVRTQFALLAGRYQVGGMTAIVCRGTGTWGPRMRLWRPGEILQLTLRAVPGSR